MIYTVTLNPSIDYHVWIPAIQEGTIHQVQKEWKDAGGKGLNVSKVLKILGMESTALGFVGGFTGDFIKKQIIQAEIIQEFIPIEQDSRINLKIKAENETDISGVSPEIPADALHKLLAQIDQLVEDDSLVLAGSVPASVPEDIYQVIMRRISGKGINVFLDAKGDALLDGLSEKPFLIKPNHHELGEIFGVTISSEMEAITYGRKAVELGAQQVIVSLAGEGAVYVNAEEAYIATFPNGEPVNSIGAGDSMVAGFLYSHTVTRNPEEAFRFAVAAGSTTALSEGFCTHEKIKRFLPSLTIKKERFERGN
ncbi:1-phosphofructokinase [Brevibacillus sp. SYSU BS000544]|uniref:1-phosphofructokinase n=1 Tax=Brevibacillus sp. SYSU BS000544 TaxID=3416443 RepID=UPI003CE56462